MTGPRLSPTVYPMATRADDRGLFKRGRRWWLRLYVKGQGKRAIPLRPQGERQATTNRDLARALAKDIRRQVEEHGHIVQAALKADLPALIDEFKGQNAREASKTQADDNAARAKQFIKDAAIKHPAAITQEVLERWFTDLSKTLRPATLRNYKAALSRFCEFLIDRALLPVNPCRRVKIAKREKLLPRFLTIDDQEKALAVAKANGIFAEVATALYTGMRREELRRMQWADVDFDRALILVPKSKSHRPRAIPMSEKLRAVLVEQKEATGRRSHVFPGQARTDRMGMRGCQWWLDALRPLQAALPIFTQGMADAAVGRAWHLFRHTFASRLVQAGVPVAKVGAWLGHASIGTTMIYSHLAPGVL